MIREYKIGMNKGNRRVWLQGAPLVEAGWRKGDQYRVGWFAGGCVLSKVTDKVQLFMRWPGPPVIVWEDRERRVSGKNERIPIIDICCRSGAESFAGCERATVIFQGGVILCEGVQP